jgi:hypothetical protein
MNIISNGYRFRRGTGSPFDYQANADFDLGTYGKGIPCQWCTTCKMSVETRSESHNQAQVWGQKHWCRRCGNVTSSAVWFQRGVQGVQDSSLYDKALIWKNKPEGKG